MLRFSIIKPNLLALLLAGLVGSTPRDAAADQASAAHAKTPPPATRSQSLNVDVRNATNAARLTDEIADSLERKLTSPRQPQSERFASENVLQRQVKKVVIDEMKVWRDTMEGAVASHNRATTGEDKQVAVDLLAGIIANEDSPVEIKRECMKHLAQFALDGSYYSKAQQIYSQLVSRYPLHPDTPAVLYRQGILYRRVGATELALSKFHAVMSTVISLPEKDISAYKDLVLLAQTEIADTYLMAGQFDKASDFFRRVLKLADTHLNEAHIRLKLIKSLFELKDWHGVITEGNLCLEKVALASQVAEVRFLMTEAYKKLGMHREAIQQTIDLLNSEQARSGSDPSNWAYWQKRTGNKLANELYEQGDYVNALLIYESLYKLPGNDEWRSQALYQIGLIYERMYQPDQASGVYSQILTLIPSPAAMAGTNGTASASQSGTNGTGPSPSSSPNPSTTAGGSTNPIRKKPSAEPAQPAAISPGLKLIREMAQWRFDNLNRERSLQQDLQKLFVPNVSSTEQSVAVPKGSTP